MRGSVLLAEWALVALAVLAVLGLAARRCPPGVPGGGRRSVVQEAVWLEVGGRRVGAVLDRRRRQVWIARPAVEVGGVTSVVYDGETYAVNYVSPPPGGDGGCGGGPGDVPGD